MMDPIILTPHPHYGVPKNKNYETYNRSERKQVFASISKFQIESVREHVTDSKEQKASDTSTITSLYIRH